MKSQQESVSNMHEKLNNLTQKMVTSESLNKVRDDLLLEISGLRRSVSELTSKYEQLKTDYEKKISDLEHQIAEVSLKEKKKFDVDDTIVITGLRHQHGEDLKQVCNNLFENGLKLPTIKSVNAERFGMRDGRPGIIKVQLRNLAEKLDVLHAKGNLKHFPPFDKVYIRPSQSHEQRLLQQHTTEVLKLWGKIRIISSMAVDA